MGAVWTAAVLLLGRALLATPRRRHHPAPDRPPAKHRSDFTLTR